MTSKDFIETEDKYGAHNYKPLDVVITRGKGVWLEDVDGNKYMDFLAAYSAVNQGHCHPRLVEVMKEQAEKLTLTSRAFRNDQWPLLAKELCELTGYDMVLPMNSGAEAVETALKAVRKWGYQVKGVEKDKAEIIACDGNFHGRTITIVTFSPEEQYKDGFGPLTPGFKLIPYGDADALEKAITPNTVAFLVEPIQGEGGVVVPPEGYLRKAKEICEKNNVLFVADEIQSGLGRTGKLFACDHEGVKPDVITIGKALSGGFYPVSAMLANKEVMSVFAPGDHGSTYGGNPLGSAIAREALKIIVEEKLPERAAELGEYVMSRLNKIKSPHVDFYRGKGLWIGIVLKDEAGGARRFCEALMKKGVLAKETHWNIIRLAPPLVISKEEIDWALERIEEVLTME
ncbi:ornithine--oxo-acid transaminase [candidate division KSB1 bacterium 4484_87]|nr:MAG: ornithine--oxo-acid transaminase [candidate division KSB1 bacterium 4484_87]